MTSSQIRQSFLDFFKSKQHSIVPSSSLMPDSPNLLFTNAGMNQFVPIFLGQVKCPYTPGRAADTQKCIRAGGKHNDLDDVGLDTYHHTFFEMLGNWSFGDYFKKEAIDWAWELVVGIWKFPAERLYATVYSPDKSKNDPSEFDQEAWNLWAEKFRAVGLDPAVHLVHGSKKDNFWMMGDTGPCGPCSELHVDLTPAGDTKGALVNKGDARCIEIWNLVFIQFNANPDGSFSPLPAKHVDTGMGFERVTSIIQGTKGFTDFANARISNYETDIFRPIFDELEKLSGKRYGSTLPNSAPALPGGAHAPSRVADRALAVGEPTRPRVSQPAPSPVASPAPGTSETKYSRRNLPHFERPWAKYMVTFSTRERRQLTPSERDLTLQSVLYTHEHHQFELYAACVMPDHVHLLFEPQIKEQGKDGQPVFWSLSEILQGIKSASAHNINRASGQKGHVWEQESVDRMIRGQSDMEEKFHYICRNPWDAGVVPPTAPYPWLWLPAGEHTRPRVSQPAPSPVAPGTEAMPEAIPVDVARPELTARAQSATREGACAPPEAAAPLPQGGQEQIDIAFRVIADHIRTLSFAIADGIEPGAKERNGVLRSIHKRMLRFASTIDVKGELLLRTQDTLVDTLAIMMGDVFPEVRARKEHIKLVLRHEADIFNRTLENGLEVFEDIVGFVNALSVALPFLASDVANAPENIGGMWFGRAQGRALLEFGETEGKRYGSEAQTRLHYHAREYARVWKAGLESTSMPTLQNAALGVQELLPFVEREKLLISGNAAFLLNDTYGFPFDLTELMARERGMTVDKQGFNRLMEEQKKRSQAAQKKTVIKIDSLSEVLAKRQQTRFSGYDRLDTQCEILEHLLIGEQTALILDKTVCYAAMGGQVGDSGAILVGERTWRIKDTQKSGDIFLHFLEGADTPETDIDAVVKFDHARRHAIERHHTVTHLLHWALHEIASRDASQKGSFVGPDKLTFDFNSAPLTPQQLADIEKLVNERILENAPVSWTEVPHADVKNRKDVMQFFGDKYGDTVRVVQVGGRAGGLDGYSMELCGGTHTRATGEIGLFRITGENAIAAGVRRIEAVAGLEAYSLANQQLQLIRSVAGKINSPVHELEKKIELLLDHQKELEKQVRSAMQRNASNAASELLGRAQTLNGIPCITHNLGDADGDFLQAIADALKSRFKGVVVLGGLAHNAVALVATVSADYTAKVQAGKIIQAIAPIVGGKGGGKPDNARGGGKDAGKLDEALAKAKSLLG